MGQFAWSWSYFESAAVGVLVKAKVVAEIYSVAGGVFMRRPVLPFAPFLPFFVVVV